MIDLSEEAIEKKVRSALFQRPLAMGPIAVGALVLYSSWLFNLGSLLLTLGGALALLGGILFVAGFFRKESLETKIRIKLLDLFQKEELNKKIELRRDLKETLAQVKNSKDERLLRFSDQATKQFDITDENFKKFEEILRRKLNPREQTFIRLYGMGQQLYFCILDNLERSTMLLDSAAQVDETYISERLADMEKKEKSSVDQREIETLKERLDTKLQQVSKVDELLTSNEEALTKIIKTMSQIAEARIEKGKRASMSMAFASESLDHLIRVVKKF
ncbi:MAG: hypothetical protein PQJ60_07375 [Spirochaetales bacterium]|nr:hypothetical protein [Spirochaetales bacterium]